MRSCVGSALKDFIDDSIRKDDPVYGLTDCKTEDRENKGEKR